jgi:hypothetical protein
MVAGAATHGMDFAVLIATKDLSVYIKTSSWDVTPDVHDTSGGGIVGKTFRGGQISRSLTIGGWTDNSTTNGPRSLELLAGQSAAFERRPDGTGSTKRKQTGNVIVGKYSESSKNDDIFQWTCDLQVTGDVVEGTQT